MTPAERLFQSFDRIYVINLAEREDRRREMADELASIGTGFDDPRVCLFPAIRPGEAGPFRSIGARGAFLSQLAVLTDARDQGCHRILMFEDDLDFVPGFGAAIGPACDMLDVLGFDIFYGGYEFPDGRGHVDPAATPLTLAEHRRAVRLAHFMGFARGTIEGLVPYLEAMLSRPRGDPAGGAMDVDGAYCWYREAHPELSTWLAQPQLGVQRPSRTDISPPGPLDTLPLGMPLRRAVRGVKRAWKRRMG